MSQCPEFDVDSGERAGGGDGLAGAGNKHRRGVVRAIPRR